MKKLKQILNNTGYRKIDNSNNWIKEIDKNDLIDDFLNYFTFETPEPDALNQINKIKIIIDVDQECAQIIGLFSIGDDFKSIIDIKGVRLKNILEWSIDKYSTIKLKENNDKKWSKERVDHMCKYGWESYGYEACFKSKIYFEEHLQKILEMINNDNPQLIINDNNSYRLFEIFNDCTEIGEIILKENDLPSKCCEIDISIYDLYSNNGFAYLSLKKLLNDIYPKEYNKIIAIVRLKNLFRKRTISVLEKIGFKKEIQNSDSNWILEK